jgi:hypothetical protein
MNLKTEINLEVKGLEATWYKVEKQEDSTKLEMYDQGQEVIEGLSQGTTGYDLIPKRLRKCYKNLITPDLISSATFTVKQYPTREEAYSIGL